MNNSKYHSCYAKTPFQGPAQRSYQDWSRGKATATVTLRTIGGALLVLQIIEVVKADMPPLKGYPRNIEVIEAPWEFRDSDGQFVVVTETKYAFFDSYKKVYTGGAARGKTVIISEDQFDAYKTIGKRRWGYLKDNFLSPNEFVPGTERDSLPLSKQPKST